MFVPRPSLPLSQSRSEIRLTETDLIRTAPFNPCVHGRGKNYMCFNVLNF